MREASDKNLKEALYFKANLTLAKFKQATAVLSGLSFLKEI